MSEANGTMGSRLVTMPLGELTLDAGTQSRVELNQEVAEEYAAAIDSLPPIRAVTDGIRTWPWDGWHRIDAHRRAGRDKIQVMVRDGTLDDAMWMALGANKAHGLRRTNADKRRAVEQALRMHPEASDGLLADHVGVSDKTVAEARRQLVAAREIPESPERTGRDGRAYRAPVATPEFPESRPEATAHPDGSVLAAGFAAQVAALPRADREQIERQAKEQSTPEIPESSAEGPKPKKKPAPRKQATKADPLKDALGVEVPAALRDCFGDPWIADVGVKVDALAREVQSLRRLVRGKSGAYAGFVLTEQAMGGAEAAADGLQQLNHAVGAGRPYAVHPACKGRGCKVCRKAGWVPLWRYEELVANGEW